MGKIQKRITESYIWNRFPKFSLVGFIPGIISFELGISLIAGYLISFLFAGKQTKMRGRVPSLAFRFKQYRIHLHHWLVFSHVLALTLILHFFVASPLLFYGFLSGIVAQGIVHYEDWYSIVQKA